VPFRKGNFLLLIFASMEKAPIGVFDSGFGGLTILREFTELLPDYDFLYLGDNARTPYGNRSYESVYEFTLQGVQYLFSQGCHLVVLACNTASAKALRTIQQKDLPVIAPDKRVLGVIRPTTERIGDHSANGHVGIVATAGTVSSGSYLMEIQKFFPDLHVSQEACPMWVPLVETGETDNPGCDYFVQKHIDQLLKKDPDIDTLLLACTHYPLLLPVIRKFLPAHIRVLPQGKIVAEQLADYLYRHPEIEINCGKNGTRRFLTTDSVERFNEFGSRFYQSHIHAMQIHF